MLKAMIGTVEYFSKGATGWQTAAEGLTLSSGDKVKTGADGMVSITFANGGEIFLKPNAEFEITSLSRSEDKSSIDYKLQLNMGKLRAMVEKLDPNSSFEIKTPTAVAAIRGTVYYLEVRELKPEEVSDEIKERLITELFVEVGGVVYTNTISGKYFAVSAGQESSSYGDGNIDSPVDVPEDKQLEWTEGWDAILNAEPYQEPDGGDSDLSFGDQTGEDSENNDRQGDQGNLMDEGLLEDARLASEAALEASERAFEASDSALAAQADVNANALKLDLMKAEMDTLNLLQESSQQEINNISKSYISVTEKAGAAQLAINTAIEDLDKEEAKISGYIIVDVGTLRGQLNSFQTEMSGILQSASDLDYDIDKFIVQCDSEEESSIANCLQAALDNAEQRAIEVAELAGHLQMAELIARIEGTDTALESLRVLIELTQAAIARANDAVQQANAAALQANNLVGNVPEMMSQINNIAGELESLTAGVNDLNAALLTAEANVSEIIDNAQGLLNNELLSDIIAFEERREKDAIKQEMYAILERQYLREAIRNILDDAELRQVDGYLEKISDAQTAKVMRDIHGNRVRVEQYILRPSSNTVELLNVNLRAGDDLTTMEWTTRFNKSLDTLPTGQLKNLPWNNYLETKEFLGMPYIESPHQSRGIYPEYMNVAFSHAADAFSESRNFASRIWGTQAIYNRELWVKDFNSNNKMDYARPIFGYQLPSTYSIESGIRNAEIGGENNNPKGFNYNFAGAGGTKGSIGAEFYVISDDGARRNGYKNVAINSVWDALRVNMAGSNKQVGDNNLEMIFGSSKFQGHTIDLIYVPTSRMEWKNEIYGEYYKPDYSLPPKEE